MKATELRIGNEVFYEETEITLSISDLVVIDLANKQGYEHKYKPIPLTEEWLLKFGFEETYAKNCFKKRLFETEHFIYVTITKTHNILSIGDRYISNEYIMVFVTNPIEYVHQLQNLFFALTGNELEIK